MRRADKAEAGAAYFVTLSVQSWTDVFVRDIYRDLMTESLKFCQREKGLEIFCYCLMTSHLHMIAASPAMSLSKLLAHFKSYTAKALLESIATNPVESRREWFTAHFAHLAHFQKLPQQRTFWQRSNYPIPVENDADFRAIQTYIHENPMKAGFVLAPEHWLHSSACPDSPIEVVPWL